MFLEELGFQAIPEDSVGLRRSDQKRVHPNFILSTKNQHINIITERTTTRQSNS